MVLKVQVRLVNINFQLYYINKLHSFITFFQQCLATQAQTDGGWLNLCKAEHTRVQKKDSGTKEFKVDQGMLNGKKNEDEMVDRREENGSIYDVGEELVGISE